MREFFVKIKSALFACLVVLGISAAFAQEAKHNYRSAAGYVAGAATAKAIAIAVWTPIYGAKQIAGEKPYKARLQNGVWIVEGSLPKGGHGGVAVAEIDKQDGRILRVSHGK